ncbi:MAG TPA: ribonuclease III [Acidobacteriaceae bacterium]|jgi:ribonuclease-3|nr:ribonuclease III [Acidobacteriaceae bacterium]
MESTPQQQGEVSETGEGVPPTGELQELEARLGYRFADEGLRALALTHSSRGHEQSDGGAEPEDNERLEFLGDAVVGMLVAEALYRRYADLSEGALTRMRGALVSRRHLAEVGKDLELGQHLLLGRGEERSGGRGKAALLANAMEAVIGAVYLDGGVEAARQLVEEKVVAPAAGVLRARLTADGGMGDFKSALQEQLQARGQGQPEYRTVRESGPDHEKEFFVEARAAGAVLAEGTGSTRKRAEQDAARRALETLQGGEAR